MFLPSLDCRFQSLLIIQTPKYHPKHFLQSELCKRAKSLVYIITERMACGKYGNLQNLRNLFWNYSFLIEPVTSCSQEPCRNGGICRQFQSNGYVYCTCPSGFTGRFCQNSEFLIFSTLTSFLYIIEYNYKGVSRRTCDLFFTFQHFVEQTTWKQSCLNYTY